MLKNAKRRVTFRPQLESLEDRCVPAVVTVLQNTPYVFAGGLYHNVGTATLTNVYVWGNQATGNSRGKGGGIYAGDGQNTTVTLVSGNVIANNSAEVLPGANGICWNANATVNLNLDDNTYTDDVGCENS